MFSKLLLLIVSASLFSSVTAASVQREVVEVDCQSCTLAQIDTSPEGSDGAVAFAADAIDNSGLCSKRTLLCGGTQSGQAVVEVNGNVNFNFVGWLGEAVKVTLLCNGTGWQAAPTLPLITKLTCTTLG